MTQSAAPAASAVSAPAEEPVAQGLDQYGRAQALEACLVEAGLPAVLNPVEGGEAEIGWAEGHEVLSRDFERMGVMLEGSGGPIDPAIYDAFMDVEEDPVTMDLAPSLWVNGTDYTTTWVECLESSGYTNPTAYLEPDPSEVQAHAQRMADSANNWIACARENGLPELVDAEPDPSIMPAPHALIPLSTPPDLLRSVMEACPNFDEEFRRRELDGDPTLEDDWVAGRVTANPFVLTEDPPGLEIEGYDPQASEEGRRWSELNSILLQAEDEFIARWAAEQPKSDEG
jgi:hypothetical protein